MKWARVKQAQVLVSAVGHARRRRHHGEEAFALLAEVAPLVVHLAQVAALRLLHRHTEEAVPERTRRR